MFDVFKAYLIKNAALTDKQFDELIPFLEYKKSHKSEVLLNKGEICHHSFFVQEGLLKSYTIDDQGKEHIIQFAPKHWFITDRNSTFLNAPSELYIDVIEESEVVLFTMEFIKKASDLSQPFREFNERLLQNHIRHSQVRINLLLSATAEQRYMNFISLYPDLSLRIPQWMIASYLGITPESLSRVRKELARRHFKPLA